MNYAQIRKYDIANGIGVRCTLFVSGCNFHCEDCFNQEYQDFNYGNKWTEEKENEIIGYLKNPNVVGITILGGEPMQQIKDNDLLNLVLRIKKETSKTIWIYSGYIYEEIISNDKRRSILKNCDILVDGRFDKNKKDLKLRFRGSSNQRIINIQESLKKGVVIEETSFY